MRPRSQSGFTLMEILIVLGLIALILGIGLPTLFYQRERGPLDEAAMDIMEGCTEARAQAIISGRPIDFVIRSDGLLTTSAAPQRSHDPQKAFEDWVAQAEAPPQPATPSSSEFEEQLHPDVAIELLELNLRDQMEADEVRVRFFPNGMSDEFTVIINFNMQAQRMIQLDPITGMPKLTRDLSKLRL